MFAAGAGVVTSVSPNQTGVSGPATPISINGSGFLPGSSVSWTAPNGTVVSISPSLIQAAQIGATIPANLLTSAGTAQIAVADPSLALSNSVSFTIGTPPAISQLIPANTVVGSSGIPLTLFGQNFAAGSTVLWSDVNGHVTTLTPQLVQAAQLAAAIPANLLTTIGTAQVQVTDPSGALSNRAPFVISPFTISSASPTFAVAGVDSLPVTVLGQNITPGSNVAWTRPDGQTVQISPSLVQASQLMATIPSALLTTAGTAQLAVANANGVPSNQLTFQIVRFSIGLPLQPSTTAVNSPGVPVSVSGNGFSSSAKLLFTPPGGQQTSITATSVQGAQLLATVPAALLTTAGTAQIAVQNANGVISSDSLPFTVEPLAITSLSPSNTNAGSGATGLSIAGQYFGTGAQVQWTTPGGTQVSIPASAIQAAQLSATIPAALLTTAGTAQVAVSQPGSRYRIPCRSLSTFRRH